MTTAHQSAQHDVFAEIESALAIIWPDEFRTSLLRACFRPAGDAEEAWRLFATKTGNPKPYFEHDQTGLKGLLPLVNGAARRNAFDLDAKLWTYLRSAALREELRYREYEKICGNVLNALKDAGVPVVALKACAMAGTIYETPAERHCHAIDVLVPEESHAQVARVLQQVKFHPATIPEARPGARQGFRHVWGLPVIAHTNLFDAPIYSADRDALWNASVPATIAGAPVRVLAPAHNLIHVLGNAFHERARHNLRWVCDAWLLIHGTNKPDWDEFLRYVHQAKLEYPMLTMLRYLSEQLGADVPTDVIDACAAGALRLTGPQREAALSEAMVGRAAIKEIWSNRMRSWPARRLMLGYLLAPSSSYVRWQFDVKNAIQLPLLYLCRPFVHVAQRLWWRALALPAFSRFTHRGRVAAQMEKLRA